MTTHRRALLCIAAVSFGLLIDEIMLSAIFNVLLGAGNTVAAITIALVGLSASGILAYALPALQRPERAAELSRVLLFWFSVSLLASTYLIMAVPIGHGDLIYHRQDAMVQLWRLVIYHITVGPFFLGGLTITLLFRSDPARIGRLYFSDLFGSALGCAVSPFLLWWVGAPLAILAGATPAVVLASRDVVRTKGRLRTMIWLPALLLVLGPVKPDLLSFATLNTMGEVNDPQYRSFRIEPGDISYERWALDAWTIIRSDQIPQQWENFRGWGLSPRYDGPIPDTILVNYNVRFSTYVTAADSDRQALGEWIDADLTSLHHLIGRRYDTVLNIGAGGGREVLAALQHGAERVVAVDVSDVVVDDLMKDKLREFSGDLYLDPRVDAVAAEGRTFAERSQDQFDLIEFSIVGGMNLDKMDLVRVDDLFTEEALQTYLSRLSPHGVFSYVMYSTRSDIVAKLAETDVPAEQPYIPALRTLTGLREALEKARPGTPFSEHVLVAALPKRINPRYDLVHIIVSLSPFSRRERARFLEAARRLEFEVLYPTEETGAAKNPYARVADGRSLAEVAADFPMSIWPATDDRPFQYAIDPRHLVRALEHGSLLRLLAGNPLVSLGLSIGSLAAFVTLIPLIVTVKRSGSLRALRSSWALLLYFACIGFAYMAVEIAALLRLQLFLGKPIYGLSVGLFAFLLASGLGSNFTMRFSRISLARAVYVVVALLVAMGVCFAVGSGPLFSSTISLSLPLRIAIAVAAIFPLAFVMGMLFPLGIGLIVSESEDLIPWAWATNGCFSVLGIFGTRIAALLVGFSRALLLGLFVYTMVAGCVFLHARLVASNGASREIV